MYWKNFIFQSSMQIVLLAIQTARNQTPPVRHQSVSANHQEGPVSQPARILNRSHNCVGNSEARSCPVNLFGGLSPPSTKLENPGNLDELFLLKKQNHKNVVSIGVLFSVMHKMPVTLHTGAGSNFLRKDHSKPFLKTEFVNMSETAKISNVNDKPLHIISAIKLYDHVGRITEPVNVFVCKRLPVPDIFECDFCYQIVKVMYLITCLVELIDGSTVPIVRYYEKQQSAATTNSKIVCFPEPEGRVFPKVWCTQNVRIPLSSRCMKTVRKKRESWILAIPKQPLENSWRVSLLAEFKTSYATYPFAPL